MRTDRNTIPNTLREAAPVPQLAYGEHATCEDIDVGNEIALHKIQSRKGLKGQAGKMWIYDDAFVMCLGSGMPLPSPLLPDIVLAFME